MPAAGTCRKCQGIVEEGLLRCPHCGKLFPLGPPTLHVAQAVPSAALVDPSTERMPALSGPGAPHDPLADSAFDAEDLVESEEDLLAPPHPDDRDAAAGASGVPAAPAWFTAPPGLPDSPDSPDEPLDEVGAAAPLPLVPLAPSVAAPAPAAAAVDLAPVPAPDPDPAEAAAALGAEPISGPPSAVDVASPAPASDAPAPQPPEAVAPSSLSEARLLRLSETEGPEAPDPPRALTPSSWDLLGEGEDILDQILPGDLAPRHSGVPRSAATLEPAALAGFGQAPPDAAAGSEAAPVAAAAPPLEHAARPDHGFWDEPDRPLSAAEALGDLAAGPEPRTTPAAPSPLRAPWGLDDPGDDATVEVYGARSLGTWPPPDGDLGAWSVAAPAAAAVTAAPPGLPGGDGAAAPDALRAALDAAGDWSLAGDSLAPVPSRWGLPPDLSPAPGGSGGASRAAAAASGEVEARLATDAAEDFEEIELDPEDDALDPAAPSAPDSPAVGPQAQDYQLVDLVAGIYDSDAPASSPAPAAAPAASPELSSAAGAQQRAAGLDRAPTARPAVLETLPPHLSASERAATRPQSAGRETEVLGGPLPAVVAEGPIPGFERSARHSASAVPYVGGEEQSTQLIYVAAGPAGAAGEEPAVIMHGPPPGSPLKPVPLGEHANDSTVVLDTRTLSSREPPAVVAEGPQWPGVLNQPAPSVAAGSTAEILARDSSPQPLTPPPLPPDEEAGEDDELLGALVDGQYRVTRRLGVGGMGAVYLAEQVEMKRLVALKVLAAQPGNRSEQERRFRREAQAASKLNHPNIVTLYGFGRLDNGTLYIVMEYVEGIPLAQSIRQEGSLTLLRVLDLGIQVCQALGEAHSRGVVHRDLKPDNILLTERRGQEHVKVLDFGIAKIVDPNEQPSDITRVGMVRGTPIYMSPEQARGDRIDHRTDIYSLGVILYYGLTGRLPINADTPFGYLHAHQYQRPLPLRQVRPELAFPLALEQLVMRCLEKRAEARPSSMAELEDGLKLLRAEALGLTPDPAWRPLAPPPRRLRDSARWLLPLGLGLGALALGAIVWGLWPEGSAAQAPGGSAAAADLGPPAGPQEKAPERTGGAGAAAPTWAQEPPIQVGDERVAVGQSGPSPSRKEAESWALAAATDQLAHMVAEELGNPALTLTIRGLAGDRRAALEGKFGFEMRRAVASGPDPAARASMDELRAGQLEVAGRVQARLIETGLAASLPAPELYWEKYTYVRAGESHDFYLAWARRTLPAAAVKALVESARAGGRQLGVSFADAYAVVAWGLSDPSGALVYAVTEGYPGAQSGVLPGDLIVAVDATEVSGWHDLQEQLANKVARARRSGGVVTLAVRRAGSGRFELPIRFEAPRRSESPPPRRTSGGGIDE